jgi:5-methylcytosine-specific restriction endonuclease McrBC regulatory subunit McrC
LVNFGLTGGFVSYEAKSKEIDGQIVFEKFHPLELSIYGVSHLREVYINDILANQLIKSAIVKVLQSEYRPEIRRNFQVLLKDFVHIDEYKGNLMGIEEFISSFYSANPYYPLVLEFAIKILKDMKMKFNNGCMEWYAFLHNSNDIFEKYVRKVVSRGISSYVTKWDKPKEIAVLSDGVRNGFKSYVPDILIDYDPLTGKANAVLDVKNKRFDLQRGDLGEVLSSQDMYQLTFYCDKLKTKLGGLVYPASQDYKPVSVLIDGNQDFRFVLFTINMSDRLNVRHRKLCSAIKEYLLYYVV